jgi:dipeptidyl aminopeptidase/acylaminoacyl peptidase
MMHSSTAKRWLAALALGLSTLVIAAPASADRVRVLKQIKVPHDYYFREMYLPQLTSGPSALAWSPDGKWLVYAMAGSLWKQKVGTTATIELTDGPGYDYQPDWSPDGKRIVFTRYLGDAVNIYVLDLHSGKTAALTTGGDVNLEPRWSPNGKHLAFISTKGTGHFHIFIGDVSGNRLTAKQWLRERKSKIYRYYYSPYDQEESPTWSPDGKDLIYVANPEIAYGSGSIWRRPVDLSAPAKLVHREETNWKAAPDWSPDGKRVIFSSYARRQWGQLWIVTTDGHDYPLALTYGNWDITRPRWSPHGHRIAYVSNQNKNTEIFVQETIGGEKHKLEIKKRVYKRKMGKLQLAIVDAGGKPITARVAILGADGRSYAPDNANVRGDDSFDRDKQAFETHYYQTRLKPAPVTLPTGKATLTIWYGDEHTIARETATIEAGKTAMLKVTMHKLDLPASFAGWLSGDVHDHMNYGGAYRTEPADLVAQAKAEDLDLVFNLLVNKEQRVPDIRYFTPYPDKASTKDVLLMHSQEYHTSYWGHLGLLGLSDHYLIPGYAAYTYTGSASLYPDNAAVADLAHKQGAMVGYVHPFNKAPDPFHDAKVTDELPIDVALGKVDYIEVVGFSNHRETASVWYRLLNCGFRLPAAAGTDAMTNYASLRGPVGLARAYVLPERTRDTSPLGREKAWLAGLKAGHSFATNGPLIGFTVDGKLPGDEIDLPAGSHTLHYKGWLRAITGIDHLQVVVDGKVVQSVPLTGDRTSGEVAGSVTLQKSGWVLLRAWNDHATPDVLDLYPYASTTPVYVQVGKTKVRSKKDAAYFLAWIAKATQSAAANQDYNTPAERAAVMGHLEKARRIFEQRKAEAGK